MRVLNVAARYRRDDRSTMRVPVVMPLVEVTVDKDGHLAVLLDREPYSADGALQRDDLRGVLDDISADLGTPVRVEVHEGDGTAYTDIITPPRQPPVETTPTARTALASPFGICGAGFTAGEQVEICVVVALQIADEDGSARLRLPPTLLACHPKVILLGRTSGTVALSEGAA